MIAPASVRHPQSPAPRRRFGRWLLLLGLGAGLVGGYYGLPPILEPVLTHMGLFVLEKVDLDVELPLTLDRVAPWIPPLVGRNLLLFDGDGLLRNLQARPWVERVSIKKDFPNVLKVCVETKRPMALMRSRGKMIFVDENGAHIDWASPETLKQFRLPVVSFAKESFQEHWTSGAALSVVSRLGKMTSNLAAVSEIVLERFPFFSVSTLHRTRFVLSAETFEKMSTELNSFLNKGPSTGDSVQRVVLLTPKKAVVSPSVSN